MSETMRQGKSRKTRCTSPPERTPSAEARQIERLRQGDPEAGHRFVRDYYPDVYRYLLYLTGRAEMAEDLTQETFLHAWRGLGAFEGRASLRVWLHRIAHRELLQALRGERPHASLEEVAELVPAPDAGWVDRIELRNVLGKLLAEQAEVVVLHYLHGYDCAEIAQIVGIHVSTIKYRLSRARLRLAQELGEGDLPYLNELAVPGTRIAGGRQWAWLPLEQMHALETRLAVGGDTHKEGSSMERREFLRQAAVGAAGLMLSETEREIVDPRLTQKVTCAFKGTALSDLCEKLKADTDIQMTAGASVADEKVTLFCEKTPLREVMRQLSRPFGYTWLRSGKPGEYRYELVQDLRSQLLEEELRNRDRNAALLALERDIEAFRPYLGLSPDQARERAKSAAPEEKKRLEVLAGLGWGPINMYFQLTSPQQAALRSGQTLKFGQQPDAGEEPLPAEIALGVRESGRDLLGPTGPGIAAGAEREGGPPRGAGAAAGGARARRIVDDPDAQASLTLRLYQSELGRFTLDGTAGVRLTGRGGAIMGSDGPYAEGSSPTVGRADNAGMNARLAHDPALQGRVTVKAVVSGQWLVDSRDSGRPLSTNHQPLTTERKLTSAEVLEALHLGTGLPIIADFYTRLYPPETVSLKESPVFEALNHLSDVMGLRWNKDAGWLQFRSASYYHDRLKEVPNRLLARWASARRLHGWLTLDDVVEIAQLPDAQLDGADMAEGAKVCWGLQEWDLARNDNLRPHLHYLAEFTPAQRQEMMSAAGLPFARMSLPQQQKFLAFALIGGSLQSLEDLAGATLRVDYTQPGWYQWLQPGDFSSRRWVISLEPGPRGRRELMPPVRERTREAALQAARRLFPPVTDAMVAAYSRYEPDQTAAKLIPQPEQIAPTELDLVIVYIPGNTNAHPVRWWRIGQGLGDG
jgi:RNA polymerase sigma-70 factor (ECF subfamily)